MIESSQLKTPTLIASIFLGLLLNSAPAMGSDEMTVTLSKKQVKVGDTIELRASIQLPLGHHIYSSTTKGAQPTLLKLDNKDGYELDGGFSAGTFEKKFDENFEEWVEFYEGHPTFVQRLKIKGPAGQRKVTGQVIYQTCDEVGCRSGLAKFALDLQVIAAKKASGPRFVDKAEKFTLTLSSEQSSVEAGGVVELKLQVEMRKDAYIYAPKTPNGVKPVVEVKPPFQFQGPIKAGKVKTKIDQYMGETLVAVGQSTWTLSFKAPEEAGPSQLKGEFRGQVCDAMTCAFTTIKFEFPISVTAKAKNTAKPPKDPKKQPKDSQPVSTNSKTAEQAALTKHLQTLNSALKNIQQQIEAVELRVRDNNDRLKELAEKSSSKERFDKLLKYHHSYEKGMEAAKKSGKNAFVVFTGHLCTNCRRMESTVLVNPRIVKILKGFERILLHVDNFNDPEEIKNREILSSLGGSGTIPAYYVLSPRGEKKSFHTGIASPKEFESFLKEGQPKHDDSWLAFILSCIGLGLITLALPCTYPMIPITISVFSKGDELNKAQALKRASIYAAGIIVSYTAIGGIVQVMFGAAGQQQIQDFANNGIVNLMIGAVFLYFAFSFFGYYEIAMPSFMRNLMQFGQPTQDDSGTVPAWSLFLMGVFFMLTSYSCGAPFVLTLFERASQNTHPLSVVFALFIFSSTIAIPFLVLALVPGMLRSMPKSGGWFTTFKVTLGFFELAFALKFLSTTDINYNLAFLTRPVFLGLWVLIFTLMGIYLLGFIRFAHDAKVEKLSMGRFILALLAFTLAIYLGSWFAGNKLEANLDALLPPHPYTSFSQGQ